MAQLVDTTTFEYSYGGVPLPVDVAGQTTTQTADANYGDTSYQGLPSAPIYKFGNVTDAGTCTATAAPSGADALTDIPGSGGSSSTDGTLSGSATHETYASNIMWVEQVTIPGSSGAVITQYDWQGKGDNSHAAQHWKLVVYLDDGSGSYPGHLWYVSSEQTVANVDSSVMTQSISGLAVAVPSGKIYVGMHLKENHLAPTYTHGGSVSIEETDTYTDGPYDPFNTGRTVTDNLRDRILTYVPNGAMTALAIITGSGALDAGTASGAATVTATSAVSGADAIADAGTVTATESNSAFEGGWVDAGTTVTATVDSSGAEALADLSSLTATEADSGSDALADAAAMTALVVLSALEGLVDAGSLTAVVVLSADGYYDTIIDSGEVVALHVTGGLEALADQGSETGVVVIVATDAIGDGGLTATSEVLSGLEALVDAGSLAALVVLTRAEKLVDLGDLTALVTNSAFQESLEEGSLVVISSATGSDEALADEATVVSLADFFGSGGHVRLIKGYARAAFTRENVDTVTLSGTGAAVSLGPQRTYSGVTGGGTSGGGG